MFEPYAKLLEPSFIAAPSTSTEVKDTLIAEGVLVSDNIATVNGNTPLDVQISILLLLVSDTTFETVLVVNLVAGVLHVTPSEECDDKTVGPLVNAT